MTTNTIHVMNEIKITSWNQLVSLPKGAKLVERYPRFAYEARLAIGHVTESKDEIEMIPQDKKDSFVMYRCHYEGVMTNTGDNGLYHINDDFFDDSLFKFP